MSDTPPESRALVVDGVPVELVRKRVKNLNISVRAPDGSVRVSAPRWVSLARVEQGVRDRLDWIRRKQAALRRRSQVPAPRWSTGETHYCDGRGYRLEVIEARTRPGATIVGDTIRLTVRPGTDAAQRGRVLEDWYRARLADTVPALIARWEPIMGVHVAEWRIRRMKTRWGSCNTLARRIWLNLALARRPPHCLEYVVVHEMTHLLEASHNARFHGLMDRFLPDWRECRAALNGNG